GGGGRRVLRRRPAEGRPPAPPHPGAIPRGGGGAPMTGQPAQGSGTMTAVRLVSPHGVDGLALEQVEIPEAGPGEALVRVQAAAITRDELEWPVDRLPAIPSYELAGVVAALGPDVSDLEAGDPV